METLLRILQVAGVIALLCFAAALATPPGRLPLALRGLQKMLRRDRGLQPDAAASGAGTGASGTGSEVKASPARRFAALVLVLLAAVLAMV